jgi:hypothetical protein
MRPTVVTDEPLRKPRLVRALAEAERLLLDLSDPVGDGHVGDLLVALPLPQNYALVLFRVSARVHDGRRHLRKSREGGEPSGVDAVEGEASPRHSEVGKWGEVACTQGRGLACLG